MDLDFTPGLDLFQLYKDTKTEREKPKPGPVDQRCAGVGAEGSKFWTYSADKEENRKLSHA